MKAISLELVLEGLTAKKDKSLSLRFSTPELTSSEKATLMDLQGVVLESLLQPKDDDFPEIVEVKAETDRKPLHVRLRGTLWVLAQKMGKSSEEAERFYRQKMERWIEEAKQRIQDYES